MMSSTMLCRKEARGAPASPPNSVADDMPMIGLSSSARAPPFLNKLWITKSPQSSSFAICTFAVTARETLRV